MTFESIYIQDNFIPDAATDQFRRKVIGVSVIIKEGETREQAEKEAEEYIADYIKRNTIEYHRHIEIRNVEDPIPIEIIEPVTELSMIDQINSCTTMKVLLSYRFLVKKNKDFQAAYDNKFRELSTE